MVWTGVLQRLGLAASARDWDNVRHRAEVRANINELSGCGFEALPHSDTLKYLMARIDPGEFNKVLAHAFRRLREARRLEIFRFRGGFTVALDGVEFNRTGRPIPRSCHRTLANGGTEYFQVALVASLVSADRRVRIPLWVEFVENPEGEYDKQDCEYKAALRLMSLLKTAFPLQRFCLLLDALYLKAEMICAIVDSGWDYVVTWRDGVAPLFSRKAHDKIRQYPRNALSHAGEDRIESFECRWANNVTHRPAEGRQYTASVLEATGTFEWSKGRKTRFAYATSLKINKENALEILARGRARWGIETEHNVQKHSELNLESPYGMRGNTSLSYCMLVMLATLVRSLMTDTNCFERILRRENAGRTSPGDAGRPLKRAYNSTMAFMRAVCDALRNRLLNAGALPPGTHIVFNSS
jgi:hypothetical protein